GLVIDMPTPVWVEGERWALHELLNNLIDNACRYTPPGSEITLTLEGDDERVTLSIEDDGPGVDAESLGRLTQPFERGRRQDTRGSGLGLAIAESIAVRHGGQLSVTNRQPRGLRVTLTLARCRPPEESRT
uniref:sensor histidine kinase n=1 Tax=Salinicola salarius TaxID=430457 RepID=UPI0026F24377